MKISIITPSFNQGEFIEQNITSVLSQNYPNFEHIVIDGGSTDNTVEILKKYSHLKWVSEPDEGQADAINKGLKIAEGEIIGWLNSDDYYLPDIFNLINEEFNFEKSDWLIGNTKYYYSILDKFIDVKSPIITYEKLICDPDIVKQPPTFFKRSFLEDLGGLNSKYYMIMDYDLWLRAAKVSVPKMLNHSFTVFVIHPLQKTNPKNTLLQTREIVSVQRREGAPFKCRLKIVLKKLVNIIRSLIKSLAVKLHVIDQIYRNTPFSTIKK